jgi:hypothetical protein
MLEQTLCGPLSLDGGSPNGSRDLAAAVYGGVRMAMHQATRTILSLSHL